MQELVLEQYFNGSVNVDALDHDLAGSETQTGYDTSSVTVDKLTGLSVFEITSAHLLKLCDDAINKKLANGALTTIAFALMFSEYFYWDTDTDDGKKVGQVIFEWDNPDINFPITIPNLLLWRRYLEAGVYDHGSFEHSI